MRRIIPCSLNIYPVTLERLAAIALKTCVLTDQLAEINVLVAVAHQEFLLQEVATATAPESSPRSGSAQMVLTAATLRRS